MFVCLPGCGSVFLHSLRPCNVFRSIQLRIDCVGLYLGPSSCMVVASYRKRPCRTAVFGIRIPFMYAPNLTLVIAHNCARLQFAVCLFEFEVPCFRFAFGSLCISSNPTVLLSALGVNRPCTAIVESGKDFCRLLVQDRPQLSAHSFDLCPPHYAPSGVCNGTSLSLSCVQSKSVHRCGQNTNGVFLC